MTDRRLRLIAGDPAAAQKILDLLDGTTVAVEVADATPWRRRILAGALVDLLCRVFPRIAVHAPAELARELEAIRTHGVTPLEPGAEASVRIAVGQVSEGLSVIHCDGDGWMAYLGPEPSGLAGTGDEHVPIGPLTAACRAAGRAFMEATASIRGAVPPLEPAWWSALTYEAAPDALEVVDLPTPQELEALLCGAGSIGGAAAYAFARVPGLGGLLDVVDAQAYEPHNPDRALLCTEVLAVAGEDKVIAVEQALRDLPLEVRPKKATLEQWVADRPAGRLPLALCAFDSIESRRELQDALPLDVIDAACSGDHAVVSGHRTNDGPCVYCLHLPAVLDSEAIQFKLIVATTKLPPRLVQEWLEGDVRLNEQHIAGIERNRGMAPGSLKAYVGRTVVDLHEGALRYGEEELQLDDATAAVAAPWVTALAGFILAGEALKAGSHDVYAAHRLGPWVPGRTQYTEHLYTSARHGLVVPVQRWNGTECLCRSTRRLRLLAERYGV